MKIPEKVKIGWKEFKVILTDPNHVLVSEGKDCYGDIAWEDNEIRLNNKNNDDQMQCTLLHEVLHGVSDMQDLDLSEDTVRRLANGLYSVVKDNPDLFK